MITNEPVWVLRHKSSTPTVYEYLEGVHLDDDSRLEPETTQNPERAFEFTTSAAAHDIRNTIEDFTGRRFLLRRR